ncbi:unnamed protein product, partial [Pelagomonas calceolata]
MPWPASRCRRRSPVGSPRAHAFDARTPQRCVTRSAPQVKMQKIIAALALSGAAAYVAPVAPKATSSLAASKDEVIALAEANPDFLGKAIGFWDPLGALDSNFWGLGNEGTIGYLRHAEIKHGRVAMAAFLGYMAGATELVSGPHKILPYRGFEPGLTPPEQWDAIPLYGKLQILVIVGMLESYGEILAPHYTKGGLPGYYPPIKGKRPELIFNLYDPFNFFEGDSAEKKVRASVPLCFLASLPCFVRATGRSPSIVSTGARAPHRGQQRPPRHARHLL